MPDEFGYVSLGVSVDVIPAAIAKAKLVIAEVNPGHAADHGRLDAARRPHRRAGAGVDAGRRVRPSGDRGPGRRADRALHQRHHRGRLDAADRPGPGHQRRAQVPRRPQGPGHPLRRDHRRDHSLAGEGHPHRAAEDRSARQDRHQLRGGHAAPVRPHRPQPAVLVPADRGRRPPDHDRRAAPDGVGDPGLRDRPHRTGLRRPARRRVLRRHRRRRASSCAVRRARRGARRSSAWRRPPTAAPRRG